MEFDADTLHEFLITAGLAPETALALHPGLPLAGQGVAQGTRAALARVLTCRVGAPRPPDSLLTAGSLDDWSAFLAAELTDATIKQAAVARIRAADAPLPAGAPYVIDALGREDARGVSRLFHVIYGDNYPVIDYYVPERLMALNRQRQVLTVVTRLPSGEIAGTGAFYRSSPPNPAVYEQGQLLVDHTYRNTSIAFRILKRLDEISHAMDAAEAFFGEAVCTHLVTQKTAQRQGYPECALELSLMPAGAYAREGAVGRVSCLICLRVDRDQPQALFLPECYREALTFLLSGFRLSREVRFDAADLPLAGSTVAERRIFDFAQVGRVQVSTIGRDLPELLDAVDAEARDQELAVVQVYLSAGAPGVAFATAELRQRGYVLGGLLPRWFGPDALMFQKLAQAPDFASVNLHSDRAKTLLGHIRADWDERHGQS
jgi:hypothetical protein